MAGFVRGGRSAGGSSPDAVLVEPVREVVETEQRDPLVVHVVEPVAIDRDQISYRLDELADVETGTPPVNTALILTLHPDGIYRPGPVPDRHTHWGDEVRFGAGPPTDPTAPRGSFYGDYTTGALYEKES